MESRYYKEQQHNYMVIKNTEINDGLVYQQKMLQIRKPRHLLPVSIRTVDGENFSYYDITSKLSMKQLFGAGKLNMEDIRKLMNCIREACDEIDKYMLDTDRLVLDPDYIFYSFGSLKYSFLYNTSSNQTCDYGTGVNPLLDYLLEHVSTQDSEATKYIYTVYEYSEKTYFDIWDALELLPSDGEDQIIDLDNTTNAGTDKSIIEKTPEANSFLTESMDYLENRCDENSGNHSVRYLHIIMISVGVLVVLICACLFLIMNLSQNEMIIFGGVIAVATVIIGLGVFYIVRDNLDRKRDEEYEESLREYVEDELGALKYEKLADVKMADFMIGAEKNNSKNYDSLRKDKMEENEYGDCEHTQYFDGISENTNYKLYAIDRKNKQHIDLVNFPFTIGKMEGFVDCNLNHPSVSRVHARIEQSDIGLVLFDLNSTNGVFINGMRLKPNEKKIIEPGDEIRIGSLNYCLRNT